jgi:hypothetical protein
MNMNIQQIKPLVIGAVVGGTVGYVVGHLIAEHVESQWEEVDSVEDDEGEPGNEEDEEPHLFISRNAKVMKPKQKIDYTRYHTKPPIADLIKDIESQDDPYQIVDEDYHLTAGDSGLTRATVLYYAGDDVFVDSDDEEIETADQLFGIDASTSFGQKSNDPDIVYIHNTQVGTVYEIIRQKGSFYPEAEERPMPRRKQKLEEE